MSRISNPHQRAVPDKEEARISDLFQKKMDYIFARDLVNKLKKISEHQIIGNR